MITWQWGSGLVVYDPDSTARDWCALLAANLALGALLCWAAKRQREHDFEMRMTCEFCSNEKTFCTCYLDNLQDKENK